MEIKLPEKVQFIINTLYSLGYNAYIVGGSVRDSLLGRVVKDYDIVTDALPDDIQRIFHHTVPLGIKHGTITIVLNGENFEVTTMKGDSQYKILGDDLALRDFTMNAMAYNSQEGLIDLFGGVSDLNNKIIRCVGNPHDTFNADPLRMMRAIRFMSELEFKINEDTLFGMFLDAKLINLVSPERIRDELNKILLSNNPFGGIHTLYLTRILNEILPELDRCFNVDQNTPYHITNVGIHTLLTLNHAKVNNDLVILLTMLLHDIGKADTKLTVDGVDHFYDHQFVSKDLAIEILKRLKYENDIIDDVQKLIASHMDTVTPNKRVVKRLLNKLGVDLFRKLLIVKACDIYGQNEEFNNRLDEINDAALLIDEILKEKSVFSLKDLDINGRDLLSIGYKQDANLGKMLNDLLEIVINIPELNNKEYLLSVAREKLLEKKYQCILYDEENN